MDHNTAARLRAFKNHCNCGGYARSGEHPHLSWCQQHEEYEEWYRAVTSDGSTATPAARIAELEAQLREAVILGELLAEQNNEARTERAELEVELHLCRMSKADALELVSSLEELYRTAIDLLRAIYVPNCRSFPTRSHMDSLEKDPDHGCDCPSCMVGRFLSGKGE